MTGPRVLYLVMAPDASAWWRVIRPVERLKAAGYPCDWWAPDDISSLSWWPIAHDYDAVVLTRLYWARPEAGAALVGQMKAAGLTVLYEVDDDWYSRGSSERLHAALPSAGTVAELERARDARIFALRLVDGVVTSTEPLAEVIRGQVNVPVAVVPNAIDAEWWAERAGAAGRLVPSPCIGWLGGPRPDEDLAPVAEAWGRIARRYPDAQFVVTGTGPDGVAHLVPSGRVWPIPWQSIDALPGAWANVDIACCAVADNAWNRRKTPIKVWEATLSGAAVVASPTLYGDVVESWRDGLLAWTPDDWEFALSWLIGSERDRQGLQRLQYERTLRDHSLTTQMHRWPEAWAALVESARMVAV